jgi:type IX secretion system PorP/SprF family membrane protein
MKRIILLAAISCLSLVGYAQQIPLYSNYFFTPFVYNPALSGSEGVTSLTLLHRRQWSDVQGAPETSALALNGSLNEAKVGWSIYGFTDVTDIVQRMGAYGNYAYRLRLADNATLSFGLGAGYLRNDIDVSSVRVQDGAEPIITITNDRRGTFDLNTGVNLQIADFNIGFAVPQLIGGSIEYNTDYRTPVNYSLIRHYLANARYDFKFDGDKMVLSPNVMVRVAENVPFQLDAGVLFSLKEYGYLGAMFRSDYAVTANVGLNLTEEITFGYAYDFSLNEFGPSLGTSHEFMLTYRFGSNKRNERLENEIKRLKQDQRKMRDQTEEIVDEKLEEFKDEYRREIQKEIEEAAAKVQITAPANTNNGGGNQGGQPAGGNNTGNNNMGGNQGGGNQGGNNMNNGQAGNQGGNNAGNGGQGMQYNAANQANNVAPGSKGYYIVAGVFSNQQNAEKLVRNLSGRGIQARYFQDMNNFYYYVYMLKFDTYQEADRAKSSNLNGSYTGELWIKIVE